MKLIAQGKADGYNQEMLSHYCPGCDTLHGFAYINPQRNGALWTFNNNFDKPTFTPSMHIQAGPWPKDYGKEYEVCHYFLTDGVQQFLDDCTHEHRGLSVPLKDVPAKYLKASSDRSS